MFTKNHVTGIGPSLANCEEKCYPLFQASTEIISAKLALDAPVDVTATSRENANTTVNNIQWGILP
jgi:hypothetical protein